jgi:hypothetical protein
MLEEPIVVIQEPNKKEGVLGIRIRQKVFTQGVGRELLDVSNVYLENFDTKGNTLAAIELKTKHLETIVNRLKVYYRGDRRDKPKIIAVELVEK